MTKEIIHWFKAQIYAGKLKPGDKLQSRRFYEIKFNTSKKTIEKIFTFLRHHNFIYAIEKNGYYVNDIQKQMWWKSERLLIGDYKVDVTATVPQAWFNLAEAIAVFNLTKSLNVDDFYTYYKCYFKKHTRIKISCSINAKTIKFNKAKIENSFYILLFEQNIQDSKRLEVIRGHIYYPQKIRQLLGIDIHYSTVLYVALLDQDHNLIHATKQYIRPTEINWQYRFNV